MRYLALLLLLSAAFISTAQIKVMTYNIRNSHAMDGENAWEKRRATLVGLIKKVNPDILGTQEVIKDQLKYLKTNLSDYESFGVGRNNGKHAGEHSALFFRKSKFTKLQGGNFWLSETPNIPGSKSWDAALTRICSWVQVKENATGKTIYVFNTHFDHKGKIARRNSAALIRHFIDSIAGGSAVIVTGDFNLRPDDAGYTTMTENTGHKILLSDAHTPDAPDYTDCGFEVANKKCGRIDYIFYSPDFASSNYTLYTDNNGTYYPSDHLTISTQLNWK